MDILSNEAVNEKSRLTGRLATERVRREASRWVRAVPASGGPARHVVRRLKDGWRLTFLRGSVFHERSGKGSVKGTLLRGWRAETKSYLEASITNAQL